MRTATYDRKQVLCRNASHIAYGKVKAQFGDLVQFVENAERHIGRVVARIDYAPPSGDAPAIRNWLMVAVLNVGHAYRSVRWVNPDDVSFVESVRDDHRRTVKEFFSDDFMRFSLDDTVRSLQEQWSTTAAYVEWRKGKP